MKNTLNIMLVIGLFSPIAVFAADNAVTDTPSEQASQIHIRSLAASCAACHGTQGKAALVSGEAVTATLAGMDKHQLESKLLAFKAGSMHATVMHRHAKGLTEQEISALAEYFSMQPAGAAAVLNTQKLRADHGH